MKIHRYKTFNRQYLSLKPAQQKRIKQALALFIISPMHPDLYNHALSGEWEGYRSIAFGGDWRAHYRQISDDEVIFVACGTHSQLYK